MRGSPLKAEPGSHPGDVGPGRERVQVKHGLTPAVDGQCDAKDANDVHDDSCTGLMEKRNSSDLGRPYVSQNVEMFSVLLQESCFGREISKH